MPHEPPWTPEGSRAGVIVAADHIEQRLDEGWDPADLEAQMDVLEALFMRFMAASRGSSPTYTQVLRDGVESMEAAAREVDNNTAG